MELERKLASYVQDGDDLEAVMNFLEAANFLSNERFSESLVRRRQTRFGNLRILAELQSHDLKKCDLAGLKLALSESEGQRATELLHKKFQKSPQNNVEKAKQMNFLAQRGFSSRAIYDALRVDRVDCEDTEF
jgi:regulatory protein